MGSTPSAAQQTSNNKPTASYNSKASFINVSQHADPNQTAASTEFRGTGWG